LDAERPGQRHGRHGEPGDSDQSVEQCVDRFQVAQRAGARGLGAGEEEHEMTLDEERVVVQKEAVPVPRVRLEKDTVTEHQQVDDESSADVSAVSRGGRCARRFGQSWSTDRRRHWTRTCQVPSQRRR
jgi:hypothetical protein